MNHFERLLRRALQRPVAQPGTALRDPFDESAEWPLESTPPLAASPALPQATAAQRSVTTADAPDAASIVSASPSADVIVPVLPNAPLVSPMIETRGTARPQPSIDRARPAASTLEPAEPAAACAPLMPTQEVADDFMRGLGVRVPEIRTLPLAGRDTDVGGESPPTVPLAPRDAVQSVLPPPPPSPRIMLEGVAVTPAAAEVGDTSAEAPERASKRASSAVPAVAPREIVVVQTQASAPAAHNSGGGAPHFGLGQL